MKNINSKITTRYNSIVYINKIVIVNICFDSDSNFVNQEIIGDITYSSENINSTTTVVGIGGGSNGVFGFSVNNDGNIVSHLYPSNIKTTTYATINCVYCTNKNL